MIVKRYSNADIDWNIGSLYAHDDFVWKVLRVCNEINESSNINHVFGSIPCVLQGGRIPPRDASISDALDIIDTYNSLGVGCRFTFSSTIITDEDLNDDMSNQILSRIEENNSKYDNVKNGVIVASDKLATYLKERYESLELIASQVKPSVEVGLGNDTSDYYNSLFDMYDIVVVNPFKINDGVFLDKLNHHDRVEFIVNHRCLPNCPMAGRHYQLQEKIGKDFLLNGNISDELLNDMKELNSTCDDRRTKFPLAGDSMSYSDIEYLISLGFKHFKLEGRDCPGTTFVRDMGDYIFNHEKFSRLAHSILGSAV